VLAACVIPEVLVPAPAGLLLRHFGVLSHQDCQNGAAGNIVKTTSLQKWITVSRVCNVLKKLSTLDLSMPILPFPMQTSDLSPHIRDLEQDLLPVETWLSVGFVQ
jgi:hypothetical protein